MAKRAYKIGSGHPFILHAVLPFGNFLGIVSVAFSKFCYVSRNPFEIVHRRAGFCEKIFFCPKNWENGPKMDQNRFFLIHWKKMVININWICFIIKIYIICCIPAQIHSLEKILFLRYNPKCSQQIRLHDFQINYFSRKINETVTSVTFFHIDTNS